MLRTSEARLTTNCIAYGILSDGMVRVKRKRAAGSESELLARISQRANRTVPAGLVKGIGDDCAIFRASAGEDLVFTTDLLIEDVHFERATHRAGDVGWKALARGLSDIAAMGATPRFCL